MDEDEHRGAGLRSRKNVHGLVKRRPVRDVKVRRQALSYVLAFRDVVLGIDHEIRNGFLDVVLSVYLVLRLEIAIQGRHISPGAYALESIGLYATALISMRSSGCGSWCTATVVLAGPS